eukprot:CAMPEP_0181298326 /NCGR_PEP_ID=MMETSP1101-20121128/5722_1 /TAXON_ID=46948 /ORGANISM="Rhodomonas abbreviata, Strain Caron Lab Isolate" /LENGTH=444 /DNA_ID=CAMNT_0023403339 /DNA_START=90 /DNA_END=1424 /DNA_ORIENTATION=-
MDDDPLHVGRSKRKAGDTGTEQHMLLRGYDAENLETGTLSADAGMNSADTLPSLLINAAPIPQPETRVQFRLGQLYEVIPSRLSFTVHRGDEHTLAEIRSRPRVFFFSSDLQERFQPFCADFGPVSLSIVHRFIDFVHTRLMDPRLSGRMLAYYCDDDSELCANTAFLLGCYAMLKWSMSPQDVFAPFKQLSPSPFPGFRDATYAPADYTISLLDCFDGLNQGVKQGWYSTENFDVTDYEFWDNPANGDLHIVVPQKFVAFKGPSQTRESTSSGFPTLIPDDYAAVFRSKGVSAVVRLNETDTYEPNAFSQLGFHHYDLYFDDCTVPSVEIVKKFLDICDTEQGLIAVHCKAGLGRTGTLIALWMMKHLHFSANECIAWLRIVRPGSVIGAQQHFLKMCDDCTWEGNELQLINEGRVIDASSARAIAQQVADAMGVRDQERMGT